MKAMPFVSSISDGLPAKVAKAFALRSGPSWNKRFIRSGTTLPLLHNQGAQKRYNELIDSQIDSYPRLEPDASYLRCGDFAQRYQALGHGEECRHKRAVVYGSRLSIHRWPNSDRNRSHNWHPYFWCKASLCGHQARRSATTSNMQLQPIGIYRCKQAEIQRLLQTTPHR